MGAKRKAAKTAPKKSPAKKKAAKKTAPKKTAPKKAAPKKAAPKKPAARPAVTRGLTPEDLAARIAATGLVPTAYVLPWEPIHGPGDYASIAGVLRDLAKGDFPLEDVRDTIDLERGEGTLEVSLDGVRHVIDVEVRGAELDEVALVVLGALFDRRQEKVAPAARRGIFVDPSTCRRAHTHLLIVATADAAAAVNAATGAAFIKATEL
jgi:hypothetical protein